jgi:hypothetical protein
MDSLVQDARQIFPKKISCCKIVSEPTPGGAN